MLDLSSWSLHNNPTDPAKKKPRETTALSSDRKRNRRDFLNSQPYVSLFLSLSHSSIGTLFLGETLRVVARSRGKNSMGMGMVTIIISMPDAYTCMEGQWERDTSWRLGSFFTAKISCRYGVRGYDAGIRMTWCRLTVHWRKAVNLFRPRKMQIGPSPHVCERERGPHWVGVFICCHLSFCSVVQRVVIWWGHLRCSIMNPMFIIFNILYHHHTVLEILKIKIRSSLDFF